MYLGLPFPTYLGWFFGPVMTIATAIFCIAKYRKFLKEDKDRENQ
jgi:hypothetical protein